MRTEAEHALALRQQRLLLRSEALRSDVALQARALAAPLAMADQVRAVAAWLYARRVWIAGAAVVVLVVRPRRAWRAARWAWWLWRSASRMRAWLGVAALIAQRGLQPQEEVLDTRQRRA